MQWLTDNWIWILLIGGMLAMHLFGHGGHGGHGGRGNGGHGGHGGHGGGCGSGRHRHKTEDKVEEETEPKAPRSGT